MNHSKNLNYIKQNRYFDHFTDVLKLFFSILSIKINKENYFESYFL